MESPAVVGPYAAVESQTLRHCVVAIIPALNEEQSVGLVINAMPSCVNHIVVVDNGSTDATGHVAQTHGARVCVEPRRGYGQACLAGLRYAEQFQPTVILFTDADFSDNPLDITRIVDPILKGDAELVIGSRLRGKRERGSLTVQQIFGNWLATSLIRLFWRVRFTDLGPLRAITWDSLQRMKMSDTTYGWTVEMQIKAARMGIRSIEIPVSYRRRIGISKISGTVKGTFLAGTKILSTIARNAIR